MPRGNPRVQVRLEPETIQWLKDYAERNKTTMSGVIKECIERLKRKEEDLVSKVEPEPPDDGKKRLKVSLWLRVENNNKFVRGRKKSREEIEWWVLNRYEMQKLRQDGNDYELTIPYDNEDDLDDIIYDIIGEIANIADSRYCFIECNVQALDGSDRAW
jgi:hypothetical protein